MLGLVRGAEELFTSQLSVQVAVYAPRREGSYISEIFCSHCIDSFRGREERRGLGFRGSGLSACHLPNMEPTTCQSLKPETALESILFPKRLMRMALNFGH